MLRLGIVGTGKVALGNYIPFLARQPDVALAYINRSRSKAEAAAEQYGGTVCSSLAELMAWGPDVVFVLTRETERYEAALALLEYRPRRLFFEKPLVARAGQAHVTEQDFYDGREVLHRAAACDCETAMIFNYRFFDQVLAACQTVASRDFGSVVNVTGLVHYACWSHCIDLIHLFAGPIAELVGLQSQAARSGAGIQSQDVTVAFRTEADASGTLIGTAGLDFRYPLFELTFNFEHGRIRLRDLDGDTEVLDYRTDRHELISIVRDRSRWAQYDRSFEKSLSAYLDALRRGDSPPVPGRAGLQELQVEAAIRRSICQARPVRLADEFPLEG